MQRFGFLYGGYSFQYWETVDMMRKLIIGAIPVFVAVQPLGSLQAIIGEVGCSLSPCTQPVQRLWTLLGIPGILHHM